MSLPPDWSPSFEMMKIAIAPTKEESDAYWQGQTLNTSDYDPRPIKSIYLIASLRNPEVVKVGNAIRALGIEAFDDWSSPGPEADDYWKTYSEARGQTYREALASWSAKHVFEFDRYHLDRCDAALLILPAGRSCGIEFGYTVGRNKPAWCLLDRPDRWDVMFQFATGIFDNVDDFIGMLKNASN